MRLLVDAQLPPALARWLTERGHDAKHVADVGLVTASDPEIWNYARNKAAALITKDQDFALILRQQRAVPVIWIRFGNTTRLALLARMDAALPAILIALEQGETLIEVR